MALPTWRNPANVPIGGGATWTSYSLDTERGASVRKRQRTVVSASAGGVVFSADMAGNAYALYAGSGAVLWRSRLEGAAGGGVITYVTGGQQYVAFVAGTPSTIWPVDKKTAKVVVYSIAP